MQQVKNLGYDGVELAGLYGLEPEYIKQVLDEVGLIPISAHVPLVEMMEDAQKVADTYKKWREIYCNSVSSEGIQTQYAWICRRTERVCKNRTGDEENDIKLEYHNHDFEFVTLPDGTFGFDDIYTQIRKIC